MSDEPKIEVKIHRGEKPVACMESFLHGMETQRKQIDQIIGPPDRVRRALRLLAVVEAGTHKVVPIKATAENGMKYNLIGEFRYDRTYADDDGNERDIKFDLTWPETKEAYDKMLQAAPDFFGEDGK